MNVALDQIPNSQLGRRFAGIPENIPENSLFTTNSLVLRYKRNRTAFEELTSVNFFIHSWERESQYAKRTVLSTYSQVTRVLRGSSGLRGAPR